MTSELQAQTDQLTDALTTLDTDLTQLIYVVGITSLLIVALLVVIALRIRRR